MSKSFPGLSKFTKILSDRVSAAAGISNVDALQNQHRETQINSCIKEVVKATREKDQRKWILGIQPPFAIGELFTTIQNNLLDPILVYSTHNQLSEPAKSSTEGVIGQVIEIEAGSELRIANPEMVAKAQVIITPGLGGASSDRALRNTYAQMAKLASNLRKLIYSPKLDADQDRRYIKGAMPYVETDYINQEESENFFEKIFMPIFFDQEKQLKDSNDCKRVILLSHSIGAREAGSHLRYLKAKLEESGHEEDQIKKYMNKILCVNIGSPLTQSLECELSPSVYFISLTDCGSKKPEKFFNNIFLNPDLYRQKVTCLTRYGKNSPNMLLVMGPDVIPPTFERSDGVIIPDFYGHGTGVYIAGIMDNVETRKIIESCQDFVNPALSDEQALEAVRSISQNSKKYPNRTELDRENTKTGLIILSGALSEYSLKRENAIRKGSFVDRYFPQKTGEICADTKPGNDSAKRTNSFRE